mmetsp:Transcript_32256/g.71381  ORF Transcript_32256/g.71381 Transcript_32256/m.71381 type:complete len:448 (+) Transcript_32256:128-1471(+)|eukprot:CAMPEP_0202922820 /NCGR_PEP_ID=MMETSP1392-20130828/78127_1 /ASSEMBLY_ACC=CAM_ASM_000868 /TAXON_ID=225041 /ORGANISM="Chlamydomonas chlamydogama, Strain SAG 11-48b" /LENGTH=447 /DNA_ID=CAMNT_0049616469 /DNA_START=55 /DNA_END=1398 /DNA_ORIENTATION=-
MLTSTRSSVKVPTTRSSAQASQAFKLPIFVKPSRRGSHARAHPASSASLLPTSADAIRDFDGNYGAVRGSRTSPSTAYSSTATPTPELLAELSPEEQRTISIFQDNCPSVVNVSTSTQVTFPPFFAPGGSMQVPRGAGSGFVWDTKGHVITNSHVVPGTAEVSVALYDGTVAKASVVGRDVERDVAVLKLDLPADKLSALRPIRLGSSSNLLVGQKVYALGNPFGLDQSLTQGIVSGVGREIGSPRGTPITNVIQTDAAINPGNSGGPLLNSSGALVGINTAIVDPTGVGISSGVGFAIPIDPVKGLVEQILRHGRVIRPALGISIMEPPRMGGAKREGVLVVHVRPGGPADVAGLQPTRWDLLGRWSMGDIIVALNGRPIKKQSDLYAVLDGMQVGDAVEVTLERPEGRPWQQQGGSNGSSGGAKGSRRVVRVVLADREKMQWGSE